MKLLKKLGRRLLEPSTAAGVAGVPGAAVVASVLFPPAAPVLAIAAPLLSGLLIGRKERKTIRAEIADGDYR